MFYSDKIYKTIESLVGEYKIIKNHRINSNRTGVLEIEADNQKMFVKMHNRLNRWSPEVYAYKNWTSVIKDFSPKLIHYFKEDNLYGLIITAIPGRTINEYQIKDETILKRAYYNAGQLLKMLHNNFTGTYFGTPSVGGLPLENDIQTNPVEYISRSLEVILKSGYDKGCLNRSDKELVEWCIKNRDVFVNSKPVPTNWDYSPNNWMIDEEGMFRGIIDFENMIWGIDVDSFGVVVERYTQDKPIFRDAIFEGYGLEDSLERQIQLKIISAKIAIADITYGADVGDERLIKLGRNLISNLK